MLFNILINDTDSGTECIPSRSGDGTKLSSAADTTEGWDIIQRDLDKLGNWAYELHEVQQVQVPAQDRYGPAGVSPEEATKMTVELEYLSYGDRLRELGQFNLEKASRRHYSSLPGP
ncbi:hypothetical protein TURU_109807 [Turdus rufiventris]|nr:hypothetical protein TURU_109807 [Turdus rufiventris]